MALPVPPPANAPARTSPDWTVQAADTVEKVVVGIRDKTTVPLTTIARGLVYGLVAGTLATVALLVLVIGLLRLLDSYVPLHHPSGRSVWVVDLSIGAVFTSLGLLLLRKARKPGSANA